MQRIPKTVPFRKMAKGGFVRGRGQATIVHGSMALCAKEIGRITARQIEASRRSIRHALNRQGTVWIRIFPNRPVTGKPTEVRMGGGTGSIKYWSTIVKPGTVRFELDYPEFENNPSFGKNALIAGSIKLPIRTYVIQRAHIIA